MNEPDRDDLREQLNTVLLSPSSSRSGSVLHIPDGDEPLCHLTLQYERKPERIDGWEEKPIEVFPKGYRGWCEHCVRKWEDTDQGGSDKFRCRECDRDAVGLVKVEDESLYLCRKHYRDAIQEYAGLMDEHRLLPV